MIKITSFYLFQNFLRITQRFYEEKAIVTVKSLTVEREFEFEYKDVGKIYQDKTSSTSQIEFAFGAIAFFLVLSVFFLDNLLKNSILLNVLQILVTTIALLFITGFIKYRYYTFLDDDNKVITYIKNSHKNRDAIKKIIELVKRKSNSVDELNSDNPFPNKNHKIELIDYDVPRYFSKCTTRFYEHELITTVRSLVEDSLSKVTYEQLNGKVSQGKEANDGWDSAFWIILVFAGLMTLIDIVFNIFPKTIFIHTLLSLGILLVISLLMKYKKQEIAGFHDKTNKIMYWTWVKKSNKEKIEEIIKFVKSNIPQEEK